MDDFIYDEQLFNICKSFLFLALPHILSWAKKLCQKLFLSLYFTAIQIIYT